MKRKLSPATVTSLVVEDGEKKDDFDVADGDDEKIHLLPLLAN